MQKKSKRGFGSKLLSIAPPYGNRAPAGSAYLLGYLKSKGCYDFDFLDLRLQSPFDFTPTYGTTGAFGESYVLDIPDLPLVLQLLDAFEKGKSLVPERTPLFERYCIERGISPHYLQSYLGCLDRYLEESFAQIPEIDFIGFSVWTPNYFGTMLAAAHLKRRRRPPVIVAGGPQVTSSYPSAALGLRSGLFDVVALSEGEATLYELYSEYSRTGAIPEGVPGTIYREQATGLLQKKERRLSRLDTLPLPSFSEMPLQAYQSDGAHLTLPFQLSRGCTDKCSFCSEWVFWRQFRPDSPEHAVSQIKELKRLYGATFIEFSDSLLNGHHKRLVAFAEQVLSESIEFGWTSFMRAQMDKETAKLIARAGCNGVFVGIESFSDETLKLMNKRRTEADNVQAIRTFVEAGIRVTAGFIPGFPGDSRDGFLHSVAVLRGLQDEYPGWIELHEEPFTVMANAPIYHRLAEYGLSPRYWDEAYLDIAPRYRDLVQNVLCSVEGASQGLERIGRTKIVGAVKSDAPIQGTFVEGEDEALPLHSFQFEHLHGEWYLAKRKSAQGHRYCLLVNEKECEELRVFQEEMFPLPDLSDRRLVSLLARIEREHLVGPNRGGPKLVRSLYRKNGIEGGTFTVSPHVIAREIGGKRRRELLVMDSVTDRSYRRLAEEAPLLKQLSRRPQKERHLWRTAEENGWFSDRERMRKRLRELNAIGILTLCDAEDHDLSTLPLPIPPTRPNPVGPNIVSPDAVSPSPAGPSIMSPDAVSPSPALPNVVSPDAVSPSPAVLNTVSASPMGLGTPGLESTDKLEAT